VPTVLIADDERLFVDALELILAADERIEVVGRALDGRQAIALARELDPDVVLMDLSMPGIDGFDAIAAIVGDKASRRVVVLSGSADPGDIEKARAAGAFGYLMKDRIADELVPGVLAASGSSGGSFHEHPRAGTEAWPCNGV
jgi:DNA-binding NarL/FixJ family response regulator